MTPSLDRVSESGWIKHGIANTSSLCHRSKPKQADCAKEVVTVVTECLYISNSPNPTALQPFRCVTKAE